MNSNSETVLEFQHLNKSFGNVHANNDVNLKIRRGSIHAIIGENGAGKSTLMNLLMGIHKPDSGIILLNGAKTSIKNPLDAARHGIGMVCQEFMLFSALSVLENIVTGCEQLTGGIFLDQKKAKAKIEEICETYHFTIPLDETVSSLPVAIMQQIEIVKILYRGADILIFDEPTSVLTPQGISGLFEAMRFLVQKGKTIIFITHKLKEVMEISDAITVMKSGSVVDTVSPEGVNEEILASMMVGRNVILTADKHPCTPGKNLLHIQNLSVRDDKNVERVRHISFDIYAGEIVGIAGVAGSGQAELISSIIGLTDVQPDSILQFEGADIRELPLRARRCLGIGYVPQDRLSAGVNGKGAVWESAIMGYHIKNRFAHNMLDKKRIFRFTDNIIREYAVKTPGMNAKVREMSGGNIQKLIVGREFLQNNKLLIIEDPTRGIDVGAIEFIWKRILELADSGIGVLLVSHELNEVMKLSDRLLVMYNGEIKDGGKYAQYSEQQIGLLMMGGSINV